MKATVVCRSQRDSKDAADKLILGDVICRHLFVVNLSETRGSSVIRSYDARYDAFVLTNDANEIDMILQKRRRRIFISVEC